MLRKLQTNRPFRIQHLESRYLLTAIEGVDFDPCLNDSELGNDIHGDTVATATLLPADSERVSNIDSVDDVDVFRYEATNSHITFVGFSINEISMRIFAADGEQISRFDINHIGAIRTLYGYSPFGFKGELVFGSIETQPGESYFFEVSAAVPTDYSIMLNTPVAPTGGGEKLGLSTLGLGADSRGGDTRATAELLEFVSHDGFSAVEVGPTFVDDVSDVDLYRFTSDGNEARIDLRTTFHAPLTAVVTNDSGERVAELSLDAAGVDRIYQEIVPGQEYTLEVRADEPTEYTVIVLTRTNEAEASLRSDFNNDGEINFADFLILSANFGNQVDTAFTDGDVDGDSVVGFVDFLLFSETYGQVQ